MAARDIISAGAVGHDRPRRGRRVAPVDRRDVIRARVRQVGIGEGGHDGVVQGLPLVRGDGHAGARRRVGRLGHVDRLEVEVIDDRIPGAEPERPRGGVGERSHAGNHVQRIGAGATIGVKLVRRHARLHRAGELVQVAPAGAVQDHGGESGAEKSTVAGDDVAVTCEPAMV